MWSKQGKTFKNAPSKICRRQPLKNFTWFILEHFVPNATFASLPFCPTNSVKAKVLTKNNLSRAICKK